MKKSVEERLRLLEHKLSLLEPKKDAPKTTRTDRMLKDIGIATLLFHASDELRRNPESNELDDLLTLIYGGGLTSEKRYACSKEMGAKALKILEEVANEIKSKQEPYSGFPRKHTLP